jgi:hypothetical protein
VEELSDWTPEHNGRTGIVPGLDLLRTIGPTTMKFPLRLEINPGETLRESMERLKEEIRITTDNPLGYGMLRYTCPDPNIRNELGTSGPAQVFFNSRTAWVLLVRAVQAGSRREGWYFLNRIRVRTRFPMIS